jgi:hypothetical protein
MEEKVFAQVVLGGHFVACLVLMAESKSLVLFGVAVLLFSLDDSLFGLFVYASLFLHLAFVFARLRFEKSVPAFLLRCETVVTLCGGPLLVCLLSFLFPSPRYLHVTQFGCVKFLLGVLWHERAKISKGELVLSGCLFFMFGVVPVVVASVSSVGVVVGLLTSHLAALTRHCGPRVSFSSPSVAVIYFYLVLSRAFLPFVERELMLPLMFQNFLRSFVAFFLFVATLAIVRSVPSLDERIPSRLPADWDRFTVLQLVLFSIGQSQLPVILIGLSVHQFATPFSLVSVLIATTPVFATVLKSFVGKSADLMQLVIVLLGVLGACLVSLSQMASGGNVYGVLLSLSSALIWAASGVLHEKYLVRIPLLPKSCAQSLFGASFALLCSLLAGEHVAFAMFDGKALLYLAFLALGFSFVSLLATVFLLSEAGLSVDWVSFSMSQQKDSLLCNRSGGCNVSLVLRSSRLDCLVVSIWFACHSDERFVHRVASCGLRVYHRSHDRLVCEMKSLFKNTKKNPLFLSFALWSSMRRLTVRTQAAALAKLGMCKLFRRTILTKDKLAPVASHTSTNKSQF